MRHHAKASTAGSTKRRAKGFGRILRGAFAARHASLASKGSSAPAARRLVLPVGVFGAILALLALVAIPAGATKTHLFKETFGSAAQPSFGEATAIAVDQSSGDVLVMDAGGTPSIKRYNPDGTAANFSATGTNVIDGQGTGDETPQAGLSFSGAAESQIAVDNSGGATDGDIYVTQGSPNLINIFSEDGEYLGQLTAAGVTSFAEACGVAVDSSGAVYVGDYSAGIHKFAPAANPPVNADNTATFATTTNPCTVAAGAGSTAGFLFAAQYNGPISKLDSSTGELKYQVSPDSNKTVAVDPATGHIYGASESTIKEFDASGAGSADQASTSSLSGEVRGLAVRGSTGNVYASRSGISGIEVFGPLVAIPTVITGSASSIDKTTATFNGTVNPDGIALEECKFEYGTTTGYGQVAPCAESNGAIGSGTSPVPVHADLSGLTLGADYHFRLVAKNANGTVNGADTAFKTLSPPVIVEAWAVDVVRSEATLKAKINPEGFATTYKLEWGTDSSYGHSTAGSAVGSDNADHTVSNPLDGLNPGTVYHYRFVATNSIGTVAGPDRSFTTYATVSLDTDCPNQAFRIGPGAFLPDCRAYEMVSPVDKNGGDAWGASLVSTPKYRGEYVQASSSGEKITFTAGTSFGDERSNFNTNHYIADRGAEGWSTHGINPPVGPSIYTSLLPSTPYFDTQFQGFNEDLSSGWVWNVNETPLTPNAAEGFGNLYRRNNVDGSYEALTVNEPTTFNTYQYGKDLGIEFGGASDDGSHQVFDAEAALTSDAAPTESRQVYDFSDGELHLVSVLPDGTAYTGASHVGTLIGGYLQISESVRYSTVDGAVSEDGSRIFWSKRGGSSPLELYVRENPAQPQSAISGGECTEAAKACTIQVSGSAGNGQFWAASPSGSEVLFSEELSFGVEDLYTFDAETETPALIAHEVTGVLGASEDLSHIYFTSKAALAGGATAGKYNLYLDHNGTTTFIATLSSMDVAASGSKSEQSPVDPRPFWHNSRITPDGRHIAFQSNSKALSEAVAGYDNTDALSGEPDMEVYTYEAGGELICASCNPSGARPTGSQPKEPFTPFGHLITPYWTAAWIPPSEHSLHTTRLLSDDGDRLFFNSIDPLLPQDTNGVQDVYEWRAQGSGGCQKESGCIGLISSGESPEESQFIDASPSGDDVFFRTAESIDPRDPGLIDIYDARVGGGFTPPASASPCVGDVCQSAPEPPNDPTPASAGFRGAGNPTPTKSRRSCRARNRHAGKGKRQAKSKHTKRCKRTNRRAGR